MSFKDYLYENTKSAAYKAGYSDGKRGTKDRRASSKWAEEVDKYEAGYRDGERDKDKPSAKATREMYRRDFKKWEADAKATGGEIVQDGTLNGKPSYKLMKDDEMIGRWSYAMGVEQGYIDK